MVFWGIFLQNIPFHGTSRTYGWYFSKLINLIYILSDINAAQIRQSTQTCCNLSPNLCIFLDFYVFFGTFLSNILFHGTSPTYSWFFSKLINLIYIWCDINAAQIRQNTQTHCILTANIGIFMDFLWIFRCFLVCFLQNIPFHGSSSTQS